MHGTTTEVMVHNSGENTRKLSFKLALHILKSFRDSGILSDCNEAAYAILLKSIARKKLAIGLVELVPLNYSSF